MDKTKMHDEPNQEGGGTTPTPPPTSPPPADPATGVLPIPPANPAV